ncbi:hypothetical protein IC582_025708 [Cucumis melo]
MCKRRGWFCLSITIFQHSKREGENDNSRCKSDKKRNNNSRSSIESINIDLDADEDTPSNKGVEGTPCQLSIGSINNIVAVAMIVEDNIGCSNVKVLVDVVTGENLTIPNPVKGKIETLNQALGNIIEWPRRLISTINDKQEHSTRKDVVYSSNYTDVNGIIKLLNRHVVNNMNDVDMIRIPMNELIFGSDKFVYLAREDLLHYYGMVEIDYMCILAYITFHWMLHVIDLRENCVSVLDSLRSKVNEDIHEVINVCWMIVFVVVLYGSVEKCAGILVLDLMHCRCLLLVCHGGQDVLFDMCDYIYKWIYWRIWSSCVTPRIFEVNFIILCNLFRKFKTLE